MTEPSDLRELLLNYKLGKLSAEDRETLDEQMVSRQEFSDRIAEAEYDLLDDYRAGRLTRAQHRRVEMIFSPQELKRGPIAATEVSTMPIPAARHTALRLARPAVAASILAIATGLLILYLHKTPSRPQLAKTQSLPALAAPPAAGSPTASTPPDQHSKTAAGASGAVATLLLEPVVARGASGSVLDLPKSVRAVRVQWVIPSAVTAQAFSLSVEQAGSVLTTVNQHGGLQNAGGSQFAEFKLYATIFARYPENARFLFVVYTSGAQHAAVGEYPVSIRKE